MNLKEIDIFAFFNQEAIASLSQAFEVKRFTKGYQIIKFGQDVGGIYIVHDGCIEVLTHDKLVVLAHLQDGAAFGEMSLIEPGQSASANLVVKSDEAAIFFCDKKRFYHFLSQSESYQLAFFRGVAMTVSKRLRTTNAMIESNVARVQEMIGQVMAASQVSGFLGATRQGINDTGSNLVSLMFELIPILEKSSDKNLLDMKARMEALLVTESQNIDRLSQQVDLIQQHFNNIYRILSGQPQLPLKGDLTLFEKIR